MSYLRCCRLGPSSTGRFGVQQPLHHRSGIAKATGQILGAAILFNQTEAIGSEFPPLINVGHSCHQRTDNDFSVVLEKVDLKGDIIIITYRR